MPHSCEPKFFVCKDCGNVAYLLHDAGVPIVCNGEPMIRLDPSVSEGAGEKHKPVVNISQNIVKVEVGSVYHPMEQSHSIQWIYLQTEKGGQLRFLTSDEEPRAEFCLHGDKAVAAYAYCNLHGLWKTDV